MRRTPGRRAPPPRTRPKRSSRTAPVPRPGRGSCRSRPSVFPNRLLHPPPRPIQNAIRQRVASEWRGTVRQTTICNALNFIGIRPKSQAVPLFHTIIIYSAFHSFYEWNAGRPGKEPEGIPPAGFPLVLFRCVISRLRHTPFLPFPRTARRPFARLPARRARFPLEASPPVFHRAGRTREIPR